MKLLWVSNAPWTRTGYGNQTSLFAPRARDAGWDVAIACNYGFAGGMSSWEGIPVYPTGHDPYSNDVIPSHAGDWLSGDWQAEGPGDGWVFTLFDVYTFKNPRYQRFNVACWTPVDHLPVPPEVARWFTEHNAVPVAMSKFGHDQLRNAGLDALYTPHGIDTKLFHLGDKRQAKAQMGLPADAFVVSMNAANKGTQLIRKSFDLAFMAFSQFARTHDDAVLYMHTLPHSPAGVDLRDLASFCGIPESRLFWVDPYHYITGQLTEKAMCAMYQASDVLLAPSKGEGFGIPVVEAQACGTPVIASNFSAQPELVGDGWLVQGEVDYDFAQRAAVFRPSIESIFDALEQSYLARTGEPSPKAREFALGYDVDHVWREHFRPTLDILKARTPSLEPITVGSL